MPIAVKLGEDKILTSAQRRISHRKELLDRWRHPINQQRTLAAIIGLAAGFWICLGYGMSAVGLYYGWKWKDAARNPQWQRDALQRDLPLDAPVGQLSFVDYDGRPLKLPQRGTPTMLLLTGNCAACAARDYMVWLDKIAANYPKVQFYVVVNQGDRQAAYAIWQAGHFRVPLILDPNGEASFHLNSIYSFRQYILDSKGNLIFRSSKDSIANANSPKFRIALAQLQKENRS